MSFLCKLMPVRCKERIGFIDIILNMFSGAGSRSLTGLIMPGLLVVITCAWFRFICMGSWASGGFFPGRDSGYFQVVARRIFPGANSDESSFDQHETKKKTLFY